MFLLIPVSILNFIRYNYAPKDWIFTDDCLLMSGSAFFNVSHDGNRDFERQSLQMVSWDWKTPMNFHGQMENSYSRQHLRRCSWAGPLYCPLLFLVCIFILLSMILWMLMTFLLLQIIVGNKLVWSFDKQAGIKWVGEWWWEGWLAGGYATVTVIGYTLVVTSLMTMHIQYLSISS